MTDSAIDGDPLSNPGGRSEPEGQEEAALGPRDFVVAQEDGSADLVSLLISKYGSGLCIQ